jgi:hypothetical protein
MTVYRAVANSLQVFRCVIVGKQEAKTFFGGYLRHKSSLWHSVDGVAGALDQGVTLLGEGL